LSSWFRAIFLDEFLLIGLCASFSFLQVTHLFGTVSAPVSTTLLAGILTLCFYQAHKSVNFFWERMKSVEGHHAPPNWPVVAVTVILTLALLIYDLWYNGFGDILLLAPAFLLGGAYVLPTFRDQLRLRDLRLVKIFIISFCWAWITGVWPILISNPELKWYDLTIIWAGFERLSFILALTVPFDIRDMALDRAQGTMTLPLAIGIRKAKWIAYISLGCHYLLLILAWAQRTYIPWWTIIPSVLVLAVLAYTLIIRSSPDKEEYFFSAYIDGCILVEALTVLGIGIVYQ